MRPHALLLQASIAVSLVLGSQAQAAELDNKQIVQQVNNMQQQIDELKDQLAKDAKAEESQVKIGGAVRLQYSHNSHDTGNRERGGDLDFDLFRLNFDGKISDITMSAEWRWYQYMNVVHHAWLGYAFDETNSIKLGVQQVPFGVLPYSANNFFFSSNFYTGLEDDYDTGINYQYDNKGWDLDLGYFFNDELGGIDGYVDNRSDRYSYDVVGIRTSGEGTFDKPSAEIAEANSFNARLAYKFNISETLNVELGASGQYGDIQDKVKNPDNSYSFKSIGSRYAFASHLVVNLDRWNLKMQATRYEYDLDSNAEIVAVGAFSFYDSMPAEANSYTANLAYSLPVNMKSISNLTFYNDYSVINEKSGDLKDTWMNVTGVMITSGALYTYVDFMTAENQPFIGGSLAGDGDIQHRLNINLGYYF